VKLFPDTVVVKQLGNNAEFTLTFVKGYKRWGKLSPFFNQRINTGGKGDRALLESDKKLGGSARGKTNQEKKENSQNIF